MNQMFSGPQTGLLAGATFMVSDGVLNEYKSHVVHVVRFFTECSIFSGS
jgi:hypothetical protein